MTLVVAKVGSWAVEGDQTPQFLIKVDRGQGRPPVYHLVLAHWTYDVEKATDQSQVDGCAAIANDFVAQAPIVAEVTILPATLFDPLSTGFGRIEVSPPRRP